MSEERPRQRLASVTLDEDSIGRGTPDQEHEREIAIYDLIEENVFALPGHDGGPYSLFIALHEAKLAFDIRDGEGATVITHILSLTPFRRILKDYFMVCESYFAAVRSAGPERIEAVDMGRRGIHDEGAELLRERLAGKIDFDHKTARRLFTLLCALRWKG